MTFALTIALAIAVPALLFMLSACAKPNELSYLDSLGGTRIDPGDDGLYGRSYMIVLPIAIKDRIIRRLGRTMRNTDPIEGVRTHFMPLSADMPVICVLHGPEEGYAIPAGDCAVYVLRDKTWLESQIDTVKGWLCLR